MPFEKETSLGLVVGAWWCGEDSADDEDPHWAFRVIFDDCWSQDYEEKEIIQGLVSPEEATGIFSKWL